MCVIILINPDTMNYNIQNTFQVLLKNVDISCKFSTPVVVLNMVDMEYANNV